MTETEALADVIALSIHAATEPLMAQIRDLDARLVTKAAEMQSAILHATTPLLERIAGLEARAPVPGPVGPIGPAGPQGERGEAGIKGANGLDGKDGADGLNGKDGMDGINGKDGAAGPIGLSGKDGKDGLDGKDGRDGLPGVPGRWGDKGEDGRNGLDGKDGKDGMNGKDGRDGLGFEDLDITFDAQKGYLLRFSRDDQAKEFPLPIPFDAGLWEAGRLYPKGAGVTRQGAFWIAQAPTKARPGDDTPDSRAWRLSVKGGRDGKPGKDGKDWEPPK